MGSLNHGISTEKKTTSVSTPNVAESGVIFAVGTAPVQQSGGKINEVVMVNTYEEAVEKFGYSDDWDKYSLSEVIYTAFKLYQTSPLFLVNVLDPATHKKNTTGSFTVTDNQILLPLEAIASSVKITEKEVGTDFEVFYNNNNCIIEFITEASGEISVTFDEVDVSKIKNTDIIGGVDTYTHKSTGLELIDSVFPKYTMAPDIILCPNWSQDSEVAAIMSAKAENINNVFEAVAILDIDTTAGDGVTYYSDATAWKKSKNFTSANQLVCFPKLKLGDRIFNFSTQLACLMAQTDNDGEYGGGTPCESASNKKLQADSAVLADGTEVLLDVSQANYLNDNGIIAAVNLFNGFVSWGNYTACYPGNTDPVDYFYCISRMFKWVAKTVTQSYWSFIDRGLKRRIIDAVLQSVNIWLNGLTTEEKILGGRIEFREDENSTTDLMAGRAKFHVFLTPPSPLQEMDFVFEYDASYLSSLFSTTA